MYRNRYYRDRRDQRYPSIKVSRSISTDKNLKKNNQDILANKQEQDHQQAPEQHNLQQSGSPQVKEGQITNFSTTPPLYSRNPPVKQENNENAPEKEASEAQK